jgi:hypothetical protein
MPLFIDTYGSHREKATWLSLMLLSAPLGVILGYSLTGFLALNYSWQTSFLI